MSIPDGIPCDIIIEFHSPSSLTSNPFTNTVGVTWTPRTRWNFVAHLRCWVTWSRSWVAGWSKEKHGKSENISKKLEHNEIQWNIKLIMMIIITIMIVRQRSHCISRILGWTPGKTSQNHRWQQKMCCSPWHRITCISKTGQLEPAIYGFFSAIIVDHWRIFKRFKRIQIFTQREKIGIIGYQRMKNLTNYFRYRCTSWSMFIIKESKMCQDVLANSPLPGHDLLVIETLFVRKDGQVLRFLLKWIGFSSCFRFLNVFDLFDDLWIASIC